MLPAVNHSAFARHLANPAIQAVSFDVFDTVLVRTFARPTHLFAALGQRLAEQSLTSLTPERFAHLRTQAETQARHRRADAEPSLTEIHDVLATHLGWNEAQRQLAEQAEIALERESLTIVPPIRAWIEAARAAGKRLAFVSDMYLPGPVLRSLLDDHHLLQPADLVLVSCDYRVSKASGYLFDRLTDALALPPGAILHLGDHPQSDATVPQARGFNTLPLTATRLGFFEECFLAYQHDTAGLSGRLAATARLARLTGPTNREGAAPALHEIGTGLLGPWLTCFALWTFERARRAGIKRLYYVSRDGQVMRDIALAVQARWAPAAGIECRYLHGSRIAWHHAAMTELGDHQLRWLLTPQPCVNAAILSRRLGLSLEALTRILAATPAASLLKHDSWQESDIAIVNTVLREKSAEITARPEVAQRRAVARRYLEQEGLLDGTPWAVVELGWSGSMMVSLHEALGRPAHLQAYYLNLGLVCPDLPAAVRLDSFAINPHDVSGHLCHGLRHAEMIEVLTAADHGTVLGYEEQAGLVGPRLKTDSPPIWPLPALAALREGARQFVAHLPPDVLTQLAAQLAHDASARLIVHQLLLVLADFMRTPPARLARAFTVCCFTEDPVDHQQRGYVRPLGFWPTLRSGWSSDRELWAQGSLACTPPPVVALAQGGVPAATAQLVRGLFRRVATVLR